MANDSVITVETLVGAEIPTYAGTGPVVPVTITITAPGFHDIDDLTVPPDVDVTFEAFGAGGGGAGAPFAAPGAGSGGGSAAHVLVTIPAASWALGGVIEIPAAGTGGGTSVNGTAGSPLKLSLNFVEVINLGTAGGGIVSGAAGAGAVAVIDPSLTDALTWDGEDGFERVASEGGSGGDARGPGGGMGGAGGVDVDDDGTDGGAPGAGGGGAAEGTGSGGDGGAARVVLSWNVP
jgi:hypothetical protein